MKFKIGDIVVWKKSNYPRGEPIGTKLKIIKKVRGYSKWDWLAKTIDDTKTVISNDDIRKATEKEIKDFERKELIEAI